MATRNSDCLVQAGKGICFLLLMMSAACKEKREFLFENISSESSKINFINRIEDTDSLNILDYLYYYNGGGVSVGDVNNDGLPDIYFVSNQESNKLFLNKGNWVFEDITTKAGVEAMGGWKTGTTMADINGDGLLDIYVSAVTEPFPGKKIAGAVSVNGSVSNRLLINQGNLTFREEAAQWGIDVKGFNTQAVFFDMDKDGDLDLFQLQHSVHQTDVYGDTALRKKYSEVSGGKLLMNEGNRYRDVTKASGITSSALGYGLGVAVADFNHDGWEDIYVGNDFHENDYYYLNQGNGKFVESSSKAFGHVSNFSMGNDAADINNDGWIDLLTLDMLPADEKILKSSAGDRPLDTYENQHTLGYHYQNARNCLQLNTAQGERFSEIGLYSGIAATDWSWSALIADYDLDGNNDIFITNGIKQRLNDLDYIKFISAGSAAGTNQSDRSRDKEILSKQPEGAWHNYIFKGSDSLVFTDKSVDWGMEEKNLSNGAAYADLDNDGDLDLVTNNINSPAGIYRNLTRENKQGNFVSIRLEGNKQNRFGIGAKVFVFANKKILHHQLQPSRGFMSSTAPEIIVGLGNSAIDSMVVIWPGNTMQVIRDTAVNKEYVLKEKDAVPVAKPVGDFIRELLGPKDSGIFEDITNTAKLYYRHRENDFDDFNRQWFIPHKISTAGPALDVADANGDGLDDIFLGGGRNQPGAVFMQQATGSFTLTKQPLLDADSVAEDVDAIFFDADKDGDADLYVVSGGNEWPVSSVHMQDRLYLNNGKGSFDKKANLPAMRFNKSAVAATDYDNDGDLDLFVAGRSDVYSYGIIPPSYLLQNDGAGNFTDVANAVFGNEGKFGMLTDACWADIDNDKDADLVVAGEWMAPTIYVNDQGKLKIKPGSGMDAATGWWQTIETGDIDGDGRSDIIAGNYGLNSKLSPVDGFPLTMLLTDPDKNKTTDQILMVAKDGKYFPFLGKEDLERQLPFLKKEYLSYSSMAGKTGDEIFKESAGSSNSLQATTFASAVFYNSPSGEFSMQPLPYHLQWAPLFSFVLNDFDRDGRTDIFSAGNFYGVTPYEGRYDALLPAVAYQHQTNSFRIPMPVEKALNLPGEYRKCRMITLAGNRKALLLARNNDTAVLLGVN